MGRNFGRERGKEETKIGREEGKIVKKKVERRERQEVKGKEEWLRIRKEERVKQ
jgi:hypothetical protein